MYLWWQRRMYARSYQPGYPPWSYSVYVAESVRDTGTKRPKRRTLVYLGSVNPERQQHGYGVSERNHQSACAMRVDFWYGVETRLAKAVRMGILTDEQRQRIWRDLADAVPPPSDDHRIDGEYGQYHDYKCRPAPLHLPAHVQAATEQWGQQ